MAPPNIAHRRTRIKLDVLERPDTNSAFNDLPVNQQLYVWANWNHMRAKLNQAAVPFPRSDVVTHRPWKGITAAPNVTVEPHLLRDPEVVDYFEENINHRTLNVDVDELEQVIDDFDSDAFNDVELYDTEEPDLTTPSTSHHQPESTTENNLNAMDRNMHGPPPKRPRVEGGQQSPPGKSGGGGGKKKKIESAGADGGFDSAQGPETYIHRPMYDFTSGTQYFCKVHHMKAFAIPFAQIDEAGTGATIYTTTPLAEIPWEYPWYYLSQEEFNLIPDGSFFTKVKITVDLISVSTSFETGSTASSVATYQHPKIGMIGFDLINKMRDSQTRNVTIDASTGVPSTTTGPNPERTNFQLLQYGRSQADPSFTDASALPGVALAIPFNTKNYFCLTNPGPSSANISDYANGFQNLTTHITQVNLNDYMWSTVFEREYDFSYSRKGAAVDIYEPTLVGCNQDIGNASTFELNRNINNWNYSTTTPNPPQQTITLTTPTARATGVEYTDYLEQGAHFSIGDTPRKPARMPSVHFGLKAIPKLAQTNNTNRASEFVDADLYYTVKAELYVTTRGYPNNNFVKPQSYNVPIEKGHYGTGFKDTIDSVVTFGLHNKQSS